MPLAFYDTNVILYAALPELGLADRPKRVIAAGLLAADRFAISAQVLAEFYVNAVRKGRHGLSHEEAVAWIERLAEQPCAAVDPDLVRSGAALARRFRISYWDAAILAAAHDLGAETLVTEDLADGQRYGDVVVANPFRAASHP